MKTKLLILLMFVQLTTNAQNFLDTAKTWNVLECSTGGGVVCNTTRYKLVADTIIDSLKFFQLYNSYDSLGINWQWAQITLSEDTINKKVYSNGALLYDFRLNIGDTVVTPATCFSAVVDSIDTFTYSGVQRRRTFFDAPWSIWIDGIGSTDGIIGGFMKYCWVDADAQLLCIDSAGVQIYQSPNYNSCFLFLNTDELNKNSSITISPNPFQDRISVSVPGLNEMKLHLKILDISGRIVFETNVDSEENDILLPTFVNGIYYIFLNNDEEYFVEKLIKVN